MADLSLYKVDLDTPQPDGRRGESPRSAFTKYNDALDALRGVVEHIGNTPPPNPLPYMQWVDTSVESAMLRRRSADNTAWVEIGPAFQALGSAAGASLDDLLTKAGNLAGLDDVSMARNNLGLGSAASASLDDLLTKAGNLAGVADPATARSNLGLGSAALRASIGTGALYGRDSILGTVSQSGGVPTGAVIERGSNSNGEYVRFADGTQVVYLLEDATGRSWTTPIGALYMGASRLWNYPAAFAAGTTPAFYGASSRSSNEVRGVSARNITPNAMNYFEWTAVSTPAGDEKYVVLMAIGRWS